MEICDGGGGSILWWKGSLKQEVNNSQYLAVSDALQAGNILLT